MNIKGLVKKIIFCIPGVQKFIEMREKTHGTGSARYCYSVWLRYLVMISKNSLPFPVETVVELGPGNSLGIGLAAMLSGVDKYFAFDIVKDADAERNLRIFNELIELYKKRSNIPDSVEFPLVKPYLESYEFPKHILTDEDLRKTLSRDRVESIRRELYGLVNGEQYIGSTGSNSIQIRYFIPRSDPNIIKAESIDMIYSQAVMEHVDDLDSTYKMLHRWLKPNGFMIHQIDFKSHDNTREWNGHWKYSDSEWETLSGNRPYFLNRDPYSTHAYCMQKNGFKIIFEKKIKNASEVKNAVGIRRNELSPKFKDISDDDLTTSGVFALSIKSG